MTDRDMNCSCDNIGIQSYDNTLLLGWHPTMDNYRQSRVNEGLSDRGICVDRCIVKDVTDLWDAGIETYGSCCGHNKATAMINIDPEKYDKAIAMGYEPYVFQSNPDRKDTVIPKSMVAI